MSYTSQRYSRILFNSMKRWQALPLHHIHAATLYSAASLGIDNFLLAKDKVAYRMTGHSEKFISKMKDYMDQDSQSIIFSEDLKNMVHLSNRDDIQLLKEMIKKFNLQNNQLRFGSFVFGPVIMRLLYHLNDVDAALEVFNDKDNAGFFDQLMSYQLLMDLLFENKKYEDALRVFEHIKLKQTQMFKYPKNIIVLVMATCYKQNTKESFEFASNLWREMMDAGHEPMRKAVTFFAGLALNQGAPHVALEVVSMVKQQFYVSIRNLKVASLADLNRQEDTFPILRSVLAVDIPENKKKTFSTETMEKLKVSMERCTNNDVKREYQQIVQALEREKLIEIQTLDDILCQEIQAFTAFEQNAPLHSSFQNKRRFQPAPRTRPGLKEIY